MANTVTVQISGPDYHRSAVEMSSNLSVKSISELHVVFGSAGFGGLGGYMSPIGGGSNMDSLVPAVEYLKNYFHPGGRIILPSFGATPSLIADLKAASGVEVVTGNGGTAQDQKQAQSIMSQISADAQKQAAERWKIMEDTQTKIFEIQNDVTVNKSKSSDKAGQRWGDYVRS